MKLGRVLGIDLGSVRVGIAISDGSGILAAPHSTLERKPSDSDTIQEILNIAILEEVIELVIGIPNSLSEQNKIARAQTDQFIELLKTATDLPIFEMDERFTTVLATKQLREGGHSAKAMKAKIDAVAAAQILQSYLDNHGKK
mgnify:FL=1